MNRHNKRRGPSIFTPTFDKDFLQLFEDNPSTSTRAVAHELRVDLRLLWNILRQQYFHAFHRQKVQAVGPNDYVRRDRFVRWFMWQSTEKPEFPAIFFKNEACLAREEVCNTNKSCFGRNKPSCCICSLPPPTTPLCMNFEFGLPC
jgi:hypothetical protein